MAGRPLPMHLRSCWDAFAHPGAPLCAHQAITDFTSSSVTAPRDYVIQVLLREPSIRMRTCLKMPWSFCDISNGTCIFCAKAFWNAARSAPPCSSAGGAGSFCHRGEVERTSWLVRWSEITCSSDPILLFKSLKENKVVFSG